MRRIQFQTISRIDALVDLVWDEFKEDFYPGEAVTVHISTGERLTGVVRDKIRFGGKLQQPEFLGGCSRYFVSLDNRPTEEAVVDGLHIMRDRRSFTKLVVRSFIKKTVTRESWTGAPWLVKPEIAATFNIDTRVPQHLLYESKAAERKQNMQQKRSAASDAAGAEKKGARGKGHRASKGESTTFGYRSMLTRPQQTTNRLPLIHFKIQHIAALRP